MTGLTFGMNQRPLEVDEFKKTAVIPSYSTDEELSHFKEWIPPVIYNNICRAFKKLWGSNNPETQVPGSEVDGVAVLIEKNFTQNIKYVIGVDCPFFGKLMYLYMADGLDLVKITLAKFFEKLRTFVLDEDKQAQAKVAFNILDLDRDGLLNILNLLHLYKNISCNT